MTDQTQDEGEEVHARLDFVLLADGGIGVTMESLPDETNPAVHLAKWIYDHREELSRRAREDYDREAAQAGRIIESARPALRGPGGERLS